MICAGGGGIPTMYLPEDGRLHGVEAVIDKDLASDAARPSELDADLLVIATDVDGVYVDWGTPSSAAPRTMTPGAAGT